MGCKGCRSTISRAHTFGQFSHSLSRRHPRCLRRCHDPSVTNSQTNLQLVPRLALYFFIYLANAICFDLLGVYYFFEVNANMVHRRFGANVGTYPLCDGSLSTLSRLLVVLLSFLHLLCSCRTLLIYHP